MHADRHLLLGLLALQCGFINKDQLVAAFSIWTSDKDRSFEEILTENKAITPEQQTLLVALVNEHLKQHDDNPQKSLAALSAVPPIKQELAKIADPELNATLARVELKESLDLDAKSTITFAMAQALSSRFIVLRAHAKGGLGQVSVALDSELNRHVALKEMLAKCADDPASQQRFVQEAEITGQLEHPGIVPVYGLGTYANGRPYYAMRFVEGDNLKHAIDRFHRNRKPSEQLTGPRAIEFRSLLGRFIDVCNAIEYAHSRKVLHRDLKPDNILLGPYGETLVVDWGLAKALGKNEEPDEDAAIRPVRPRSGSYGETLEGSAIGTPAYMSPEQAEGKVHALGPATDIYALGGTLYSVLTGAPPVKGDTEVDTLEKVRRGDIRPPRNHWAAVPKSLEAVCLKATSLKPANRYSTAKALAQEIEKWLADEPVIAMPEPLTARARRWIKRHPVIASTAAACSLLGLIGALLFAFQQAAHAKEVKGKNKTINEQLVELTKGKAEAEKQRARAEEREQDAIAAVKRFGDVVANNPALKNSPNLKSLREELLKEPLGFFKRLRERMQGDKDSRPQALAQLASVASSLGYLTIEVGAKQDAINAYEEAKNILEILARENPAVSGYTSRLASAYFNLGALLGETGKPVESLAALDQAKGTRERLVRENPKVVKYACDLAESHSNFGAILHKTGKPIEALAAFEEAKKIWQRLARENPSSIECIRGLASIHNNLGGLLSETGRSMEALAAFEDSKRSRERLARENPTMTEFVRDLAVSYNNHGFLLSKLGRSSEALADYEESIKIRERLTRENPSMTAYAADLAESYSNLEGLLGEIGKLVEALSANIEASKIYERLARENPEVTEYAAGLGNSHNNHAHLLEKFGKRAEALAALDEAKKILVRLVSENPSESHHARLLSINHAIRGGILRDAGKPAEAVEAYEEAKKIRLRLVRENPTVTEYSSLLAGSHINLGNILSANGKLVDAQTAFEEAKKIWEQLAQNNPTVTEFASGLATTQQNLGFHYSESGKLAEAFDAYAEAAKTFNRLVRENPQLTEFASGLANVQNNLGNLHSDCGRPAEASAAFGEAKTILEQLTRENPTVAEFQSILGATFNNLAMLHLDANAFLDAKELLRAAIEHQQRALASNPKHPTYRQFLRNHYRNLEKAAKGLQDEALQAEARKELADLAASDPRFVELDRRLNAVAAGDSAKNVQELLALGRRAYDTRKFLLAARWFDQAIQLDARIAQHPQLQIPYNAACSAALAASGQDASNQALEDAEKSRLRSQAAAWLNQELKRWQKVQSENPKPEAQKLVAQILSHWLDDSDLASIRESSKLANLPEPERKEWEDFWSEVKLLNAKASTQPANAPAAPSPTPTKSQPPTDADPPN